MGHIETTVFLSYRRTNISWALAISQNLDFHGYDVFFDFEGIASGAFERVILGNIRARAHFVVLLTPSALERCSEAGDWLRLEFETALNSKRNIVPLMLEGFDFRTPGIANHLTGALEALKRYNGLRVHPDFFAAAMERLRDNYLNVPLDAVLHPASAAARKAAKGQQAAVKSALFPFVDAKEILQRWPFTQESPPTPQETALTLDVPEGIYLDPETRLMWTIEDNGTSVNWKQAKKYARELRLGGYSDWRLPTIDELEKLYEPKGPGILYSIRTPFQLSGWWPWSSMKEGSDSAWYFSFYDGKPGRLRMNDCFSSRALCVRRSGE